MGLLVNFVILKMLKIETMKLLTYDERKKTLKEFVFSTPDGYRKFFVLGKNLKDAEKNFMRINDIKRCGFNLKDLPKRYENILNEQ